ncbi:MAG TPA: DegV family protein, partial [Levilinea sp.]|nr:DegV family protein [Levilinea sp.]
TIIWGSDQYRDRVDLQPEEFYERLKIDPQRPTTAQAGIPEFQQAYENAIARGAEEIITLTVSSAMSGAYQMALSAAKLVKAPVHVIDSKGPSMSLGWQVLAAAGAGIQAILTSVEQVRKRLVQLVAMNTLEYLQKGGRIGGAVKWVGGLLQVKPLVSINHASGMVEPVSLARTQKALVEMMYSRFFTLVGSHSRLHIAVLHGNAHDKADELAERIRSEFRPAELLVNMTGPVLGVNTGPGALALCGYAEE